MTFDEVQTQLIQSISNPDTMETTIQTVLDGIKTDYEAAASTTAELEKANARIRDLQDTNHKLFLSQVSKPDEKPDEEDTGIKWDSLIVDDTQSK